MTVVDWMMAHPWMTFFLGYFLIQAIGTCFNNVQIVKNNKLKIQEETQMPPKPEKR